MYNGRAAPSGPRSSVAPRREPGTTRTVTSTINMPILMSVHPVTSVLGADISWVNIKVLLSTTTTLLQLRLSTIYTKAKMLYTDFLSLFNDIWAKSTLGDRSTLEICFYLVFFVSAWGFFRAVYLLYFHPLASFPGPCKAALSTWWLYILSKSGQTEEVLERLHKKYSMYQPFSLSKGH